MYIPEYIASFYEVVEYVSRSPGSSSTRVCASLNGYCGSMRVLEKIRLQSSFHNFERAGDDSATDSAYSVKYCEWMCDKDSEIPHPPATKCHDLDTEAERSVMSITSSTRFEEIQSGIPLLWSV